MLNKWDDSVGSKVKIETNKIVDKFNSAKKNVDYTIKDLEYECTAKFEIEYYSNEIFKLSISLE